jgi:hypothetical protein
MKKLYYLIVIVLISSLVLTGCSLLSNVGQVPTTEKKPNEGGPFPPGTLVAGKNIDVGTVIVWNDADNLYVKYVIDDPTEWCLTETHLHVATSLDGIPQKNGNPPPGQFDYKDEHDCVTEFLYTIPLTSWSVDTLLYIAAHAVVMDTTCFQTAILYGIQRNTGTVYGIDVLAGTSWVEFNIPDPPPPGSAKPNGLAYDADNERFYYCDYQPTTTLYFWDGTQQIEAGSLPGEIADADFYNGKYYFITGPPASDDLYEVTFNTNGTIADGNTVPIDDIASGAHGWTFNGDIAIKDGVVYGWGWCGTDNEYEFFTYDLGTSAFNVNTVSYNSSLQIAFGSDGILYGHRSGGAGAFYVVDTTNGDVSMVTPTPSPGHLYTDCASGMICEPVTETAWAANINFPGKNWATYFTYTVQE